MAPTPPTSLTDATLDNTLGSLLLGVVAAAFFYGITTLQTYLYYHAYPYDSLLHKFSVAILWILDGFHLALTIHCVYIYSVTGFGNILGLTHIVWSIKLQVALNVFILLMVHSLYAMRVWKLGGYHRGILGYIVASVVTGGCVIGLVLTYQLYIVNSYAALANISWIINAALGTSTAIDFVISGAMCYYLRMSQGKASHLDSRISALMQYTLSSGLFTSACSLSAMFSYILLPNTFVFLGITFLLTKLYVGSFLAMLNARERKAPQVATEDEAVHTQQKRIKCRVTSSFWSPAPLSPISPGSSTTLGQTKPW